MSRAESPRPLFLSAPPVVLAPVLILFALMIAAMASGAAMAQTGVYRCTTPSGAIEFRQRPCTEGAEEQEITIEDQRTGWEPGKTKLEGQGKETKETKESTKKSSSSKSDDEKRAEKAKKQQDKCWEQRQKLDEVNAELRRGYSASEGLKLRDKRRKYEDYLSRYCK